MNEEEHVVFSYSHEPSLPKFHLTKLQKSNIITDESGREQDKIKRTNVASFFDELQAILIGVSLHESHESVPLPRSPHYILSFNACRPSIDKFGTHIN